MTDATNGLRYVLKSESAVSLAFAGKKLASTLEAFRRSAGADRAALLLEAADALLAYVTQKEALGLPDREVIDQVFDVPPEVWRAMGRRRRPAKRS